MKVSFCNVSYVSHHMTRVVLGVLGNFLFCLQNMSYTSSIYHLNAHPHWITWLRRRPCFMRFFRQIFRFFEIFFCLEVPGVAHIYSIIPWHLGNISRIYRFCGTLWKKNYDRLKNGHFFDFLLISKKTQLVTPHSNRNDLTIPMSRKNVIDGRNIIIFIENRPKWPNLAKTVQIQAWHTSIGSE